MPNDKKKITKNQAKWGVTAIRNLLATFHCNREQICAIPYQFCEIKHMPAIPV